MDEQLSVAASMGPDLGQSRLWTSGPNRAAMRQLPVAQPLMAVNGPLSSYVRDGTRPKEDGHDFGKQSFRNVELTGAARLYRAASSDQRERG